MAALRTKKEATAVYNDRTQKHICWEHRTASLRDIIFNLARGWNFNEGLLDASGVTSKKIQPCSPSAKLYVTSKHLRFFKLWIFDEIRLIK